MAFIRAYKDSDKDEMVHIFNETAAPDLRAGGPEVLHLASHNWCRPYLMVEPENCWVLDDGNGVVVGYLLGVVDTPAFVTKYKEVFIPYLKEQGLEMPSPGENMNWNENLPNALRRISHTPEGLLHRSFPSLIGRYPAHLHIDLLPAFQRRGWGRKLIEQFCQKLKKQDVKGVHLGMAATNAEAGEFYKKLGFNQFDVVMDAGKSGEAGRDEGAIYMVKEIV